MTINELRETVARLYGSEGSLVVSVQAWRHAFNGTFEERCEYRAWFHTENHSVEAASPAGLIAAVQDWREGPGAAADIDLGEQE